MPEIETISWKDRLGNPFAKALEPAMDSEVGYIKQTRVGRVGQPAKAIYNVVYDRDFLIESIFKTVCKPLFVLGRERIISLVTEAWDTYYSDNFAVLPSKRKHDG